MDRFKQTAAEAAQRHEAAEALLARLQELAALWQQGQLPAADLDPAARPADRDPAPPARRLAG